MIEQNDLNLGEWQGDVYCSHVLNAIHFVDNNLKPKERKKYLFHIENCPVCTRYIESLRKDFIVIENLVPAIPGKGFTSKEYQAETRALVGNLYQSHPMWLTWFNLKRWQNGWLKIFGRRGDGS